MMDESTRQRLDAIQRVLISSSDDVRIEIVRTLINLIVDEIGSIDSNEINKMCNSLLFIRDGLKRFYERRKRS